MTISILDTSSQMVDILTAPEPDRAALLEDMLRPAAGMYRYFPGEVGLVQMHRMGSGFPLDRDGDECLRAVDTLREADAWGRVGRALQEALEVQRAATPHITVPDLTVLIVLGDPGDAHFMGPALGLSANGSVPGYLQLNLWPSPENVARLEATAVHELNHNLRYGPGGVIWDPTTVTVGEHIVSEGLADAFARQLYGDDLGYPRLGVPHLEDDAVYAKVLTGLDVTGMHNFTAWVHGDVFAERYGVAPVGVPTGAGYAVGSRLVDRYLAIAGLTAAEALYVDSHEVITTAQGQSA